MSSKNNSSSVYFKCWKSWLLKKFCNCVSSSVNNNLSGLKREIKLLNCKIF